MLNSLVRVSRRVRWLIYHSTTDYSTHSIHTRRHKRAPITAQPALDHCRTYFAQATRQSHPKLRADLDNGTRHNTCDMRAQCNHHNRHYRRRHHHRHHEDGQQQQQQPQQRQRHLRWTNPVHRTVISTAIAHQATRNPRSRKAYGNYQDTTRLQQTGVSTGRGVHHRENALASRPNGQIAACSGFHPAHTSQLASELGPLSPSGLLCLTPVSRCARRINNNLAS
uniref:Secreted protein n=1 Tax=Mesocestoides corti TaxID=53468 RepID=A0A5K3G110_MESCO